MEEYFRELIRGVDSSLLEEWERLRNPDFVAVETGEKPARPASFDVTRDGAAFRRLVRTAVLGFLQDVAARDWEAAAERLNAAGEARQIEEAFERYFEAHGRFRLDPEGRAAKHTHWDEAASKEEWQIAQVLVDADELNDWEARFVISLSESRAKNSAVVRFVGVEPVGA